MLRLRRLAKQAVRPLRRRLEIEPLEGRWVPATVSDGGTSTLTITLAANEQVNFTPNATTYTFGSTQNFLSGGVANSGDFSAFGATSLTLQATGIARYSTIRVVDTAAGARTYFHANGSNTYSTSFQVTFSHNSDPTAVWVNAARFSGTAGLTVNVDNAVYLPGPIVTASGSVSITATTSVSNAIQFDPGGHITSTSGSLSLNGTSSSSDASHGGILLGGGVMLSTGGSGSLTLQGAGTGLAFGVANNAGGVQFTTANGSINLMGNSNESHGVFLNSISAMTTGGVMTVTGTTASNNGSVAGVFCNSGTSLSTGGSGNLTLTGTNTGVGVGTIVYPNVTIATAAGTISLSGNSSQNHGLFISGPTTSVTSATGAVGLNGQTAAINSGIYAVDITDEAMVKANGATSSATVSVQGTTSGIGAGIYVANGSKVQSNAGDITMMGTCTNTTNLSNGVGIMIRDANTQVSSTSGSLNLTGSSAMIQPNAVGVLVFVGAAVSTTGSTASLTIQGMSTGTGRGVQFSAGSQISSTGTLQVTGTGISRGVSIDLDYGSPGSSLSATGNVTIQGSSTTSDAVTVFGTGSQIISSAGAISITGQTSGPSGGNGLRIDEGAKVQSLGASAGATLTLNGHNTASLVGILIGPGSQVSSVGGALALTGSSVTSTGIYVGGSGTQVRSPQAMTLTGTSDTGVGLSIEANATVMATATGAGAPTLQLSGTTGSTLYPALAVNRNGIVTSISSPIVITGTQTNTSTFRSPMEIAGGLVESTGTGTNAAPITIQGIAANGTFAVQLQYDFNTGYAARVKSVDGPVSITGSGGKLGVQLQESSLVQTTGSGAIEITANLAPISIYASTVSGGGAVTLTATDTMAIVTENLTVSNESTVQSTGSMLTLKAGDSILVDATSTASASAALTMTCDFGNADPGLGGRIDLQGTTSGNPVTLQGAADADGFKVAPSLTSVINVVGGATPNSSIPDGLSVITPMGETTSHTPLTSTSGTYSTTGGYQNVVYTGMPVTQPLSLVVTRTDEVIDPTVASLSLRQAVHMANVSPSADTITFAAALNGSLLGVTQGALPITAPYADEGTTITGPGAAQLTLTGVMMNQFFYVEEDAYLTLSGMKLTAGNDPTGYGGGAIYNEGHLTVNQMVFQGNVAPYYGGAIYSSGPLTILQSTFLNNSCEYGGGALYTGSTLTVIGSQFLNNTSQSDGGAISTGGNSSTVAMLTESVFSGNRSGYGGAIQNTAQMTLIDCTFSSNIASDGTYGEGGAIAGYNGQLMIRGSTFSGNQAGSSGGGAIANYRTATIVNSTFSGNSSTGSGGAFTNYNILTLRNSTITLNRANSDDDNNDDMGGGIAEFSSCTTYLFNTILAGNLFGSGTTPSDYEGTPAEASSANNLIGDSATAGGLMTGVNGNLVGVNPMLGPLTNNGGPTMTHGLLAGSPALNAGSDAEALDVDGTTPLTTDQRGTGFTRPIGIVDIGAFEVQTVVAPTVTSFKVLYGNGQSYELLGSTRLTIPWQITGLQVVFSEAVTGTQNSLSGFTTSSFSGSGTNTLTWTLTTPLALANLTALLLSSGADAIRNLGGTALDGVGSGTPGTDFSRAVKVLYGDVNGDGVVNSTDIAILLARTRGQTVPVADLFLDVNGDGIVDTVDFNIVRSRSGSKLP